MAGPSISDAAPHQSARSSTSTPPCCVRGTHETSWQQAGKTRWLSVATASQAALFQIAEHRDRDGAKALLGEQLPGVPATNNASERALRHAVLWRKTSYGTQTDHGDRLVERLLTMRETCRLQGRRLHDFLTDAITADLHGQPIPALPRSLWAGLYVI
jgi:hypothetical protein